MRLIHQNSHFIGTFTCLKFFVVYYGILKAGNIYPDPFKILILWGIYSLYRQKEF